MAVCGLVSRGRAWRGEVWGGAVRFGVASKGAARSGGARCGGVLFSLFPWRRNLMTATATKNRLNGHMATELGEPTNGAESTIGYQQPYIAEVTISGVADILFHRWNVEGIEEKSKAAKGSKAKKSDDLESYVYRNESGELCIPGEYLRQAVIMAAKFRQDPRSPRKSAMDLVKAAVVSLTPLASLGVEKWDYEDKRRVMIQRNGITRTRPAVKAGWKATFQLMVNLPEYVHADMLNSLISEAGRLIGLADFRPTYGRFGIAKFEIQ